MSEESKTSTSSGLFPPLKDEFKTIYGEEPDPEKVSRDLEAATNKPAFARRLDSKGRNLLHYFGEFDAGNSFETAPLVTRLLELDPKLAQAVDSEGKLPLRHYGDHLMDCSDDWAYLKEGLAEDDPTISDFEEVGCIQLVAAFPEGIFAAEFLDELHLNQTYKTCSLQRMMNADEEGGDDDERRNAKEVVGLLKLAFTEGVQHTPTADSVLETGQRAPFHILCSYCYEPIFESLFDVFFSPSMASLPDRAANGMLPLHLVLKSPLLCHPLQDGPFFGFCEMKRQGKSIPLPIVQKLISAHPEAVAIPDDNGCLPLHLAVRHNNLPLVKCLLEANPSAITELDHHGHSPLRIACPYKCGLDLIYFLVGANATPTQWARGLHCTAIAPPVIAPILNQKTSDTFDFTASVAGSSSGPIRWSIEVLKAWDVRKNEDTGERTLHLLEGYDGATIGPTSGQIQIDHYYNSIFRLRVSAENLAGWSSTEFEVELTGFAS